MTCPARILSGIVFVFTAAACFATLDTTTNSVSTSAPVLAALCCAAAARLTVHAGRTRRLPAGS